VKWVEVEVVVVVVKVVVAVVVAAGVGRAGWVVPPPPVLAATASAPVVGIASRTWWVSPVIEKSARSVARRWHANKSLVSGARHARCRAPLCHVRP
jgi:hypothetical protein